ncbi:MAG: 6-phosphogluconolactonase [Acidobacteriaceae bacterium]|nr:6-phosphogluconolactonase [Acidobacteriaceae bacterium]
MFGRRLFTGCGLAGLLVLAGCGSFFSNGTSGGGSGSTVASYAYVGTQTGVLASYSVSSTGALAGLSGSPLQLATAAITGLAVNPANSFLYTGVSGVGIFGLSINSTTGVPSLINTSALATDVDPSALAVDPAGTHLLVAGIANGVPAVGEYNINSDGTLSPMTGSPVTIGLPSGSNVANALITNISVAPNSSFVFVTLGQLGVALMPFTTTGTLSANTSVVTPKTSGNVSNQDLGVAVNPGSTLLFVGETNAGIRVFTIAANFPEVSGSPFAAGGQPRSIVLDGAGDRLYAANTTDSTISGYAVAASGTLTPLAGSPYSSVGPQPYWLTLDKSQTFLLDANLGGSPNVQLFSFDATTVGKLDPGATVTNLTTASVVVSTH